MGRKKRRWKKDIYVPLFLALPLVMLAGAFLILGVALWVLPGEPPSTQSPRMPYIPYTPASLSAKGPNDTEEVRLRLHLLDGILVEGILFDYERNRFQLAVGTQIWDIPDGKVGAVEIVHSDVPDLIWPLAIGSQWKFNRALDGVERTIEIIGGTEDAGFKMLDQGTQGVQLSFYLMTGGYIRRGLKLIKVVPTHLSIGDRWSLAASYNEEASAHCPTQEIIVVPFKRFSNAFRVEETFPHPRDNRYIWYVPGIGPVRIQDQTGVWDLVDYSPG